LKGIPQTDGEIALKPATDFFGIPATPRMTCPSGRRVGSGSPAPGPQQAYHHRSECPEEKGTRQTEAGRYPDHGLRAGKDCPRPACGRASVQLEAIKRSVAHLEAAGKDLGAAKAESKRVLLQGAIQEAKGYAQEVLTSVKAIRSQIEILKGLDPAKRDMLIRTVNAVAFGARIFSRLEGQATRPARRCKKRWAISPQIATLTDKLLMESGIAEKVGEELSGKLWDRLDSLAFAALNFPLI